MTNPDFSIEALQRQKEFTELQRLQAENARLREALAEAADYIDDESCGSAEFWRKYRVALDATKEASGE